MLNALLVLMVILILVTLVFALRGLSFKEILAILVSVAIVYVVFSLAVVLSDSSVEKTLDNLRYVLF